MASAAKVKIYAKRSRETKKQSKGHEDTRNIVNKRSEVEPECSKPKQLRNTGQNKTMEMQNSTNQILNHKTVLSLPANPILNRHRILHCDRISN